MTAADCAHLKFKSREVGEASSHTKLSLCVAQNEMVAGIGSGTPGPENFLATASRDNIAVS